VWDARTGQELKGEPIPPIIAHKEISPDGRFIAHVVGSLVELVPLQPDEEEVSYRRMHIQPNVWRYREGYEATLVAQDEFAARFYLNLLPPPEQEIRKAQAAADREIAAGRTANALAYLVKVSTAKADDTNLALRVAGDAGYNPAGGRVGSGPQSRPVCSASQKVAGGAGEVSQDGPEGTEEVTVFVIQWPSRRLPCRCAIIFAPRSAKKHRGRVSTACGRRASFSNCANSCRPGMLPSRASILAR
jgi:hypothetical protein